jgi:hypothetical protein
MATRVPRSRDDGGALSIDARDDANESLPEANKGIPEVNAGIAAAKMGFAARAERIPVATQRIAAKTAEIASLHMTFPRLPEESAEARAAFAVKREASDEFTGALARRCAWRQNKAKPSSSSAAADAF